MFVVLSILRPNTFFTEANFLRIAQSISILTIIATGMTFLFIAGELDLSVVSRVLERASFRWPFVPARSDD